MLLLFINTHTHAPTHTQGLDDVYTGGRQVDRVARSVEAALTVKDRFGRVLTPKERFRQLCHS